MADFNRSENAQRDYTLTSEGGFYGKGQRYVDIRCPFCGTVSRAYLWSLYGGGKCCTNNRCGAKHCKGGFTMPRIGREDMNP